MRRLAVSLLVGALVAASCTSDDADPTTTSTVPGTAATTTTVPTEHTTSETTTDPEPASPPPPLEQVAISLATVPTSAFQPIFVDTRPGDDRLFVFDQIGIVEAVSGSDVITVLDIRSRVDFGGERGLLGAAFHPAEPDRLFIHYSRTGDGAGVLEELAFPQSAANIDPEPVRTVLVIPQPAGNHNGGMIAFGPDGHLWIALGDGGGGGDPFRQGQDPFTLLGSMVRIDVDAAPPYAVPPDNPFADGTAGAPEVWAYGLRNPWRFSFDGDDVWIADVGQGDREEINVVSVRDAGANFGWPILEGTLCYDGPQSLCDENDFVDPIHEYDIRGVTRCAIVGGYVYRGTALPDLVGAYVFSDHCSGEVMALRFVDGAVTDVAVLASVDERVTSLGTDASGELYVTTVGSVWRIDPP